MLKHTFRHIHGIGEKTEKRIWAEGLTSWEEFLDSPRRAALPQWQRDLVCVELERSVRALEGGLRATGARVLGTQEGDRGVEGDRLAGVEAGEVERLGRRRADVGAANI